MSDEKEPTNDLDDLFTGRDRFLTSGEVADLLNVNTNTLYLWRQSGDIDLPFHRFIAPGQSRGMIRYRYSDVARFIQRAELMGKVFVPEPIDEAENRMKEIIKNKQPSLRTQQANAKKIQDKELSRPLEDLIEESLPVESDEPRVQPKVNDIIAELLSSYSLDKDG
jgi:hypothetical protein